MSYSKCLQIMCTKFSYKMTYASSADPAETAPDRAVWSGSTLSFH